MKLYFKIVGWIVVAFVAILGLKIMLAPVFLAGKAADSATQVVERTISADNVLHNYEWYYDTNAAYQSRVSQIQSYQSLLKDETDKEEKQRMKIELVAMQQTCRDLATKYNANSEKLNRKLFKSNGLPDILDSSCGE